MAVSLASSGATAWDTSTTPKTATVSWAAGDIIVIRGASEAGTRVLDLPTATGLTFVQQADEGSGSAGECDATIFTATAASAGSGVTVSATASGGSTLFWGFHWGVYSGAAGVTGGTGGVSEATTNLTTGAGDAVVMILADFAATNPFAQTPATGSGTPTEHVEQFYTQYSVGVVDWIGCTAGTNAYGYTSYTGLTAASAFLVLTAAATGTVEQAAHRFGADDGSESAHTFAAAQDTNLTAPTGETRLARFRLQATGDPGATAYTLRHALNGGAYTATPVGASVAEAFGTVTFGAIGTGANGGTTVAPSYPAGITAGQYLTCEVTSGATNSETPTTPSGWTLLATGASTDGTFGVDAGPRRATVFGKVADGTETGTLTVSITNGNSCRGTISRWTKTGGDTWVVDGYGANDSTSGTGVSMTFASVNWHDGDAVEVVTGQRVDNATQSAQSLTATGITFGTRTNRAATAVTTGNDIRHTVDTFAAITGADPSEDAAPTWAYTASAAASAGGVLVRLRAYTAPVDNPVHVAPSANITAGGEATTARLTGGTGTFTTGRRWDDENGADSIDIGTDGYTEVEWAVATQGLADADTVDLRVYAGGTALDTYTVTPRITIGSTGTNAPAGSGPVTTTASTAAATVRPAPTSSAVTVTAQPATGQARPNVASAPVALAAQAATAAVRPVAGSAPVTATAPAPAVTVLANAGVAAVAAAALDATTSTSSTTTANADVAAVGIAAQAATVSTPTLRVLQTYALASTDPHSLTIPGATAGRDLWLIVNCAAVVTTPAGWSSEANRVADMASYIYRLDGASNPGGSIGVTLDLSAARAVSAVAIEAKTVEAGTLYASLIAPGNGAGSTVWGTGAHTFPQRDDVLAVYAFHTSNTPNTFAASSYDQGFTALADTGWAGGGTSGDEAVRVMVGYRPEVGFTADGVALTLTAAGNEGSAVGFLAFDESAATIATVAPVAVTGGQAAATVRTTATTGPVTLAAPAPVATIAPQPGAGAATLTAQPATTTVRANAGVAAVTAQGQAATVNTSSSTNANAGVAAVGVAGSAAAASVRPAATSAPVGAAGLFDTGSEVQLQLVMDNPVAITVTASNATVSTSTGPTNANATSAPVALTAPTPTVTVRAQAGVAAVAVAGRNPSVQVTGQTLAQAGSAAVGVVATGASSTVRPVAGVSSVGLSAAGPLGQIGARPGGAVVLVAALLMLAQARGQAGTAPVAVAGRGPAMTGAGATWWVWRAGALVRHRALLDGVHPTTATIT